MAPKQLGTWVRYINSGLEEGEVNKSDLDTWRCDLDMWRYMKEKKYNVVTFWE
jgi:hypothetical protein